MKKNQPKSRSDHRHHTRADHSGSHTGSVLAFGVCMFRRTGSVLANKLSDLYVKLMQGTPILVILMVLYYIVFTRADIETIWVAITGFTFSFGAFASEIMRTGIDSVDNGQREAALALGYKENKAFFKFIFPQAMNLSVMIVRKIAGNIEYQYDEKKEINSLRIFL